MYVPGGRRSRSTRIPQTVHGQSQGQAAVSARSSVNAESGRKAPAIDSRDAGWQVGRSGQRAGSAHEAKHRNADVKLSESRRSARAARITCELIRASSSVLCCRRGDCETVEAHRVGSPTRSTRSLPLTPTLARARSGRRRSAARMQGSDERRRRNARYTLGVLGLGIVTLLWTG